VSIAKAREHQCTARKMLKQALDPRTEFNHEKLHPQPKPIPLDELFNESDWDHVQTSILHAARHAIQRLETNLFPALARIPADEACCNIRRASSRQIKQAALQGIFVQLEGVATALAANYLGSGMTMDDLVITMTDSRKRRRRANDSAH
jgi:hypothetical protein